MTYMEFPIKKHPIDKWKLSYQFQCSLIKFDSNAFQRRVEFSSDFELAGHQSDVEFEVGDERVDIDSVLYGKGEHIVQRVVIFERAKCE